MRIYDVKDIMAQIDALVMRQEKFIVRLYMKKYRKDDDLRIYNGVYILTKDGAQDYLISENAQAGVSYAQAQDIYIQLLMVYEESTFATIEEEIVKEDINSPIEITNTVIKTKVTRYFTYDEVLPLIDATAQAYCDNDGKQFVVGIEAITGHYPMHTFADPGGADAYVAELDKALIDKFGTPVVDEEVTDMLAGFDFVASKGVPTIVVGRRNRLYLQGGVEKSIGIRPKSRILIGYNKKDEAFAIALPEALRGRRDAQAAGYFVSAKKDITCAKLFQAQRFNEHFVYDDTDKDDRTYYMDKTSSDSAVAIFRRY
ncbi:hypothetical protein [Lysinibacillus sp. TE18511]